MTRARSSVLQPIAALAAIGLLSAGPAFGAALGEIDTVRELLLARRPEDTRTQDDVVGALAELGDEAVPVLVDLYLGRRWEQFLGDEDEDDPARWWRAPDECHTVFLAALAEMSATRIAAHLDEEVPDEADHDVRLTAVRIIAVRGSADCVATLFRLGESFGDIRLRYRSVQAPLESAFQAVLGDDEGRAADAIVESVDGASEELRSVLLTAVARTGRPEYLRVLTELLGASPELDIRVLELLPDFVSVAPWRFDSRPLELVRPYLDHSDWRFRRAAAFAVGKLRDVESFRAITDLLDDPQPLVATAARWALANMAGTDEPTTRTEWLHWFDEQTAWRSAEFDSLFDRLDTDEMHGAAEVIRKLVARPLFRDDVAHEFAALTRVGTRPALVLASVSALKQLGSERVVPDLLRLAGSRDESIRTAALTALGRLTGAQLPPDLETWRAFVEG